MRFLSTVFWVVVAIIAVFFTLNNTTIVSINLWNGMKADVLLPVLIALSFLIGFLPQWLLYRTIRFNLTRKHDAALRDLEKARAEAAAAHNATLAQSAPVATPRAASPTATHSFASPAAGDSTVVVRPDGSTTTTRL